MTERLRQGMRGRRENLGGIRENEGGNERETELE